MSLEAMTWLPRADDTGECLRALKQAAAAGEALWPTLRELARRRLDFLAINQLDRTAQKNLPLWQDRPAQRVRLAILPSCTVAHLVPAIRVAGLRHNLLIETYLAEYGQQQLELLNPDSALYRFKPDAVLVVTDLPSALPALPLKSDAESARAHVAQSVEMQRSLWRLIRERLGAVPIQQTPLPLTDPAFGLFDQAVPAGPSRLARRFTAGLIDAAVEDGALLLDLDWWAGQLGTRALSDPMLMRHGKQEISPTAAPLYGDLLARQLAALRGLSKKCLVLDLDNTLWGGVIGDDGLDGIKLGEGSGAGEGFLAFQRYCKSLTERGIVLAVASKNERHIAEEAFAKHPEMILKRDDIAVFEAHWQPKPTSLQRIAATLNIGIDALVFFDDNPAERAMVRQTLPAVAVPEVPDAPELYVRTLADAGYFETVSFTADDTARAQQYAANAQREEMAAQATDLVSFLHDLNMTITFGAFDPLNRPRITQLINKTNQFNLTTRRYTETEVSTVMQDPEVITLWARLVDRFGDNGLIAVVIMRPTEHDGQWAYDIDTWLMSCRVLGRTVEEATLDRLVTLARAKGASVLTGNYLPTAKNGLVAEHYAKLGFSQQDQASEPGATRWVLPLANYAAPPLDYFTVVMDDGQDDDLRAAE